MKDKLIEAITLMLKEKYQVPAQQLHAEAVYEELNLDSLTLLEVSMALERGFDIKVPDGTIVPEHSIAKSVDNILLSNAA
ncbi:phosphopantetheine-binding protein [Pseudomonas saponiphila]|uniref:Acyl carrier protein n=1 Tax=Pseudomonas saponiphila TaxID=556534 RepID=A0A1H4K5P3_9PSED|nr:phosphopantetheine-binding protein [Pseudomonas saponiphila]SEB53889.1 acyl carrier protein [Pseudomonas saponiphila]